MATSSSPGNPPSRMARCYGIYAQRYNAAGLPQGIEFRVNTVTADSQSEPAVAMDADGDFVVTWQSANQDGSGIGVYAQRYNAAGVPQGVEFRVNSVTWANQFLPRWRWTRMATSSSPGCPPTRTARLRHLRAALQCCGVAQGVEFRVNTFTANGQSTPTVAMDADGDFVVSWSR